METMSLEVFMAAIFTWATTKGVKLVVGLLALSIGWKLANRFTEKVIGVAKQKGVDSSLCSFLSSAMSIGVKVLLVILLMDYVGVDTTAFAALIASAGLAIGLALQGSLANFAGGFIILFMRPFKIGDYIDVGSYSGTVEHIRIFYTHLATPDNKEIMIPNGVVSNGTVVNYSSKPLRRVDLVFSVSYDVNISQVKEVLRDIVEKQSLILADPAAFIGLTAQGDSSLDFVVRAWVNSKDYWPVHFYLLEEVKLRFDQEGISIPYPQMDVHVSR